MYKITINSFIILIYKINKKNDTTDLFAFSLITIILKISIKNYLLYVLLKLICLFIKKIKTTIYICKITALILHINFYYCS